MNSLALFLSNNPNLKFTTITLGYCNLGPASINNLPTALLNHAEDTLESLNLNINHFGDVDLDQLVLAVNKSTKLKRLCLTATRIGIQGCRSLTKLLGNQESNLERLDLDQNSIVRLVGHYLASKY